MPRAHFPVGCIRAAPQEQGIKPDLDWRCSEEPIDKQSVLKHSLAVGSSCTALCSVERWELEDIIVVMSANARCHDETEWPRPPRWTLSPLSWLLSYTACLSSRQIMQLHNVTISMLISTCPGSWGKTGANDNVGWCSVPCLSVNIRRSLFGLWAFVAPLVRGITMETGIVDVIPFHYCICKIAAVNNEHQSARIIRYLN